MFFFVESLGVAQTLQLFPLSYAAGLLFLGLKSLAQVPAHTTAEGSPLIQTMRRSENLPKCPHWHYEGFKGSRYDSLYICTCSLTVVTVVGINCLHFQNTFLFPLTCQWISGSFLKHDNFAKQKKQPNQASFKGTCISNADWYLKIHLAFIILFVLCPSVCPESNSQIN